MNHKRFLLQSSNLLLTVLLIVSCSTPTSTPIPLPAKPSPADKTTITQIVMEAGKVIPKPKGEDPKPETEDSPDGKTRYITQKHVDTEDIDNISYLGLNDDIIWPGNLVRGDKATDFVYEPIVVERAPITLSISLESSMTTGSSIAQQVENPRLSTVRQGISDLLKKAVTDQTNVPAKVDFSYQRIYNESQISLFLGTAVKYGAGKVNANFNWDSNTKKTKILARYRQIYYSVDVDIPQNPASFIGPSMTEDELRTAIPPESKPMYITGVSYGMMALMFIETDASEENITAALDAAYSGVVKANGVLDYENILESSSIKIIVYGGSTANLKNLETGYEGFKNVIEASSHFGPTTPGVPLLYKFRHLADNTLALASITSEYTTVTPIQLVQEVRVTLISIESDQRSKNVDIKSVVVGYNAYDKKKGDPSEAIIIGDDETREDFNEYEKGATATIIDTEKELGKADKFKKLEINQPFYIEFKTDPDIYDYKNAYINIMGYAPYTGSLFVKGGNSKGKKTIYLRDFLSNEGEHTFSISSANLSLKVTLKIELVE